MENKNYTVYMHTNKANNKAYIGITGKQVEQRWGKNGKGYLRKTKYGEYRQPAMARAIEKYGWEGFEHIIWASNLSKNQACQCERLLIKLFDTQNPDYGYNIRDGGDSGAIGYKATDITRVRLSVANKGRESANKGKSMSEEQKQKLKESFANSPRRGDDWRMKISNSKKGKPLSEETKRRLSESRKGHKVSEETKKKISDANRGKTISKESAEKMGKAHRKEGFVCIETGIVYDCAYTVQTVLGIRNVKRACSSGSGRQTAGGFHWRIATEEELLLCV